MMILLVIILIILGLIFCYRAPEGFTGSTVFTPVTRREGFELISQAGTPEYVQGSNYVILNNTTQASLDNVDVWLNSSTTGVSDGSLSVRPDRAINVADSYIIEEAKKCATINACSSLTGGDKATCGYCGSSNKYMYGDKFRGPIFDRCDKDFTVDKEECTRIQEQDKCKKIINPMNIEGTGCGYCFASRKGIPVNSQKQPKYPDYDKCIGNLTTTKAESEKFLKDYPCWVMTPGEKVSNECLRDVFVKTTGTQWGTFLTDGTVYSIRDSISTTEDGYENKITDAYKGWMNKLNDATLTEEELKKYWMGIHGRWDPCEVYKQGSDIGIGCVNKLWTEVGCDAEGSKAPGRDMKTWLTNPNPQSIRNQMMSIKAGLLSTNPRTAQDAIMHCYGVEVMLPKSFVVHLGGGGFTYQLCMDIIQKTGAMFEYIDLLTSTQLDYLGKKDFAFCECSIVKDMQTGYPSKTGTSPGCGGGKQGFIPCGSMGPSSGAYFSIRAPTVEYIANTINTTIGRTVRVSLIAENIQLPSTGGGSPAYYVHVSHTRGETAYDEIQNLLKNNSKIGAMYFLTTEQAAKLADVGVELCGITVEGTAVQPKPTPGKTCRVTRNSKNQIVAPGAFICIETDKIGQALQDLQFSGYNSKLVAVDFPVGNNSRLSRKAYIANGESVPQGQRMYGADGSYIEVTQDGDVIVVNSSGKQAWSSGSKLGSANTLNIQLTNSFYLRDSVTGRTWTWGGYPSGVIPAMTPIIVKIANGKMKMIRVSDGAEMKST
jgi:hypothetical protein